MKALKLLSLFLTCTFLLISCNRSQNDSVSELINLETDIAMPGNKSLNKTNVDTEPSYLYVTASTGLSLRKYANLQSDKLAIMPYGTRLRVIDHELDPTMNIGGIIGGMDHVEYNHKTGYAFNGYLSKFFPPELDISVKGYANELKKLFPDVVFTETVGGSVSAPVNTETIILPSQKWHEAYFLAQQLFDFPSEFKFPKSKGKDLEVIKDSKPKKNIWVSELKVFRNNNTIEKIQYVFAGKGFSKQVTITNEGSSMKISKIEEVK